MSDQPIPTPADVAPKAPEAAPANPEPAAAAPEAPKQPDANVWDNPETAKAEIERLRKENAKDRTTAKQTAAEEARTALATEIGKALGLVKDEPADPVKLTEQLTQQTLAARSAQVELAVFKAAGAVGGDPAALLDSSSFLAKVYDLDPTDSDAVTAAIKAAVESNPRLGAAVPVELPVMSPNPGQGTSGGGAPTPKSVSEQIAEAEKAGDWKTANALKAQQLIEIRKNT